MTLLSFFTYWNTVDFTEFLERKRECSQILSTIYMDRPLSLVEYALYAIRLNIENGVYPPGHKLITQDISDELGISRTPVVAAVNRLIAEGFAESIPRRGTIVAQLTPKKILDMLDVRMMIELYSVKPVIKNLDSNREIISKMQSLVNEFDLDKHDPFDYRSISNADFKFHTLFISQTGNEQMMKIYASNWITSTPYYILRIAGIPLSRIKGGLDAHSEVIHLLLKKDEMGLKTLLSKHLSNISQLYLSVLSENPHLFKLNVNDEID